MTTPTLHSTPAQRQLAQRNAGYRFITTNTLTGKVLCDDLPIIGDTASRVMNSIGEFSGVLTLPQNITPAQRFYWVSALAPYKSILWILQDGVPIWNGPITGWPHDSLSEGNLPFRAATMEHMFNYRQFTDNINFTNMDVFEIFRQELRYALGKQPNGNIAGSGRFQNSVGIVDTVTYSGVIGSVVEQSTYKSVYAAWGDLVDIYLLEYALTPAMTDDGSLYTVVQMGIPQLGRPVTQTGFQLIVPSYDMQDYGWQWTPENPANRVIVNGYGTTKNYASVATAPGELAAGYPLLEGNLSFFGTVTGQSQLDAYASGALHPMLVTAGLTPVVRSGDNATLQVKHVMLGDEVEFAATSDLHPSGLSGGPGSPGVIQKFQITGWELTFPNGQQPGMVEWQLSLGPDELGSFTAVSAATAPFT